MRSLGFFRSGGLRRALAVWGALSVTVFPIGCADRSTNSDARSPIATTKDGVEIVELVRNESEKTIDATVANQTGRHEVTIAPLADGPFPKGIVATIENEGGTGRVEIAFAWDEQSGTVWTRQRTDSDEFELTRAARAGRVYETGIFDGDELSVDYPDLEPAAMDKAIAKWQRGELAASGQPELRELNARFDEYAAFASRHEGTSLAGNANGQLLLSLLSDPAFAGVVTGGDIDPLRVNGAVQRLCWGFNMCVSLFCRIPNVIAIVVCVSCVGGLGACMIAEMTCWFVGCDCCF